MNLRSDEKRFYKWLEEQGMRKDTFVRYSRYGGIVDRPAYDVANRGCEVFDLAIKGASRRNESSMVDLFEGLKETWSKQAIEA